MRGPREGILRDGVLSTMVVHLSYLEVVCNHFLSLAFGPVAGRERSELRVSDLSNMQDLILRAVRGNLKLDCVMSR